MDDARLIPPTARTVETLVLAFDEDEPPTGLCAVAHLRFEPEGGVLLLHDPKERVAGTRNPPPPPPSPFSTRPQLSPQITTPFDPRIVRVGLRAVLIVGDAEGNSGAVVLSTEAAGVLQVGDWQGASREEHVYVVPTRLVANLAEEDLALVQKLVANLSAGQRRALGGTPVLPPQNVKSAWACRVDAVTPAWLMERLVETEVELATELAKPNKGKLRRLLGVTW